MHTSAEQLASALMLRRARSARLEAWPQAHASPHVCCGTAECVAMLRDAPSALLSMRAEAGLIETDVCTRLPLARNHARKCARVDANSEHHYRPKYTSITRSFAETWSIEPSASTVPSCSTVTFTPSARTNAMSCSTTITVRSRLISLRS